MYVPEQVPALTFLVALILQHASLNDRRRRLAHRRELLRHLHRELRDGSLGILHTELGHCLRVLAVRPSEHVPQRAARLVQL